MQETSPEIKKCPQCGRVTRFEASFCGDCGFAFFTSREAEALYINQQSTPPKENIKESVLGMGFMLFVSIIAYFIFGVLDVVGFFALMFVLAFFASKAQPPTDQGKGRKLM